MCGDVGPGDEHVQPLEVILPLLVAVCSAKLHVTWLLGVIAAHTLRTAC
jgi:hypothetical protein